MDKIERFFRHTLSEAVIDRLSQELAVYITAEELLIGWAVSNLKCNTPEGVTG